MGKDPLVNVAHTVERIGAPDLETAEAALVELATWVMEASPKGTNAITAALGLAPMPVARDEDEGFDDDDDGDEDDDDDEDGDGDDDDLDDEEGEDEGVMHADADTVLERPRARGNPAPAALPPLDAALARHASKLSPATLAVLARALLRTPHDNFAAAATVVREIIARGDDAAQAAVIDAYMTANDANDPNDLGPRAHDGIVLELAYKLACRAALSEDRVSLLKYTQRALELGKSPQHFRAARDFDPYANDTELNQLFDKFS
jgi:hypothetical protein